jgi:Sigma-70, region 4
MALSEDQRALLQLLIAGESYEQIAEVLGTSTREVRERAHAAESALEVDPDADISPRAVRERLDALEGPEPVAAPYSRAEPAPAGGRRRWALWAALGAAALVVAIVLVAVGSGGGGDNGSTTTRGDQEDVVPIRLSPVGGSRASGMISVVRVADQPAVDLAIEGLTPSGPGQSYVVWLAGSGGRSLPVAFQAVGSDGKLTGRTPIPTAAEGLLPSFTSVVLTLTRQREAAAAVQRAAQSATLPQVVGTPVMRGALR